MTVLEAWERGRPVVAHRIGAMPELIEDGVTGLLADPTRVDDLAGRMEQLLSSPDEAATMGLAGRERLESHFTKSRWLEQIAKIYGKLP